jgi:uncharacterized membrane protein YqiK
VVVVVVMVLVGWYWQWYNQAKKTQMFARAWANIMKGPGANVGLA